MHETQWTRTNIRAFGEEMQESSVITKLLRAVPSRFLQIISMIEQFCNLDSIIVHEAVGSLKAHEERVKGKVETSEGKLLLTEEEWQKREASEGKLLFTREEWLKRSSKPSDGPPLVKARNKSRVRCFNCSLYGNFVAECHKPRRYREQKQEFYLTKIEDDEPALLLAKFDKSKKEAMLLDERDVKPKLASDNKNDHMESNL